jgi:hypothetical protein
MPAMKSGRVGSGFIHPAGNFQLKWSACEKRLQAAGALPNRESRTVAPLMPWPVICFAVDLSQSRPVAAQSLSRLAMKLENWCVISKGIPCLQPPEQERSCLHGFVSGHLRCSDGKEVTTSMVTSRNGDHVVTKSGSEYELGAVDAAYESLYPNARQRLLTSLRPMVRVAVEAYDI